MYDFIDGQHAIAWTTSSKSCADPTTASRYECLDAASALSFRLGRQYLLLVKWKGDFCESSYTLFRVAAALEPVAENGYGCDI